MNNEELKSEKPEEIQLRATNEMLKFEKVKLMLLPFCFCFSLFTIRYSLPLRSVICPSVDQLLSQLVMQAGSAKL